MKYVIFTEARQYGPYSVVEQTEYAYVCDGTMLPFTVVGQGEVREVADDYKTPEQIAAEIEGAKEAKERFNAEQKDKRKAAYADEADPLYFMAQRGEATLDEWQAKIAEIKARFPYKE
jgi:hypothetical protein